MAELIFSDLFPQINEVIDFIGIGKRVKSGRTTYTFINQDIGTKQFLLLNLYSSSHSKLIAEYNSILKRGFTCSAEIGKYARSTVAAIYKRCYTAFHEKITFKESNTQHIESIKAKLSGARNRIELALQMPTFKLNTCFNLFGLKFPIMKLFQPDDPLLTFKHEVSEISISLKHEETALSGGKCYRKHVHSLQCAIDEAEKLLEKIDAFFLSNSGSAFARNYWNYTTLCAYIKQYYRQKTNDEEIVYYSIIEGDIERILAENNINIVDYTRTSKVMTAYCTVVHFIDNVLRSLYSNTSSHEGILLDFNVIYEQLTAKLKEAGFDTKVPIL